MAGARAALALERFDPYLETAQLTANARSLADFLSDPPRALTVPAIQPTLTFILDTEELMETHSAPLQYELSRAFVFAFAHAVRCGNDLPIDSDKTGLFFRLFHLLTQFWGGLKNADACENAEERAALLTTADEIGLFCLAKDPSLYGEIFETLIEIPLPAAVSNLVKMVNEAGRLPTQILYAVCDHIERNPRVADLLRALDRAKQLEFVQGIRSYLSGDAAIRLLGVAADILEIDVATVFGYIEGDLGNEDDVTRAAALELAVALLLKAPLETGDFSAYILTVLGRHADRLPRLRVIAVNFGFAILGALGARTKQRVEHELWEAVKQRIVEPVTEVRLAVMQNLVKLDPS
jgi:hypothetical protein